MVAKVDQAGFDDGTMRAGRSRLFGDDMFLSRTLLPALTASGISVDPQRAFGSVPEIMMMRDHLLRAGQPDRRTIALAHAALLAEVARRQPESDGPEKLAFH